VFLSRVVAIKINSNLLIESDFSGRMGGHGPACLEPGWMPSTHSTTPAAMYLANKSRSREADDSNPTRQHSGQGGGAELLM